MVKARPNRSGSWEGEGQDAADHAACGGWAVPLRKWIGDPLWPVGPAR